MKARPTVRTAVSDHRRSRAAPAGSASSSNGLRVVGRVLDILQAFTPAEPELTAAEICRKLGLNKSTVHRLTEMVERRGFLERDPVTRAYSLGPAILGFTHVLQGRHDLDAISRRYMHDLRNRTNETVTVNIRVGTQRVCIAQAESRHELRMRLNIGNPIPLYCGAASKVLLAGMSPEEIERYLRTTKLTPMGPGSATSSRVLRDQLKKIREDGYAISKEERIPGGITLAAPIRNAAGETIASLSVYGPLMRVSHERLTSWIPLVTGSAKAISREIGLAQ